MTINWLMKLLNGSRRIPRFFSSLLETIYIKNDKEMHETIMSTNKNSSFVKEDELKW